MARVAVVGREWYRLLAAGISTSALDFPAIERAVGRGPTRTINTALRLTGRFMPDDGGSGTSER